MDFISLPSSEFCSWLGLICPQSELMSGLNDQRPPDPSNFLVEPGTSSALMLGHEDPGT